MKIKAITGTLVGIGIAYALLSFIANSLNPGEWKTWERVIFALSALATISNNRNKIQIL